MRGLRRVAFNSSPAPLASPRPFSDKSTSTHPVKMLATFHLGLSEECDPEGEDVLITEYDNSLTKSQQHRFLGTLAVPILFGLDLAVCWAKRSANCLHRPQLLVGARQKKCSFRLGIQALPYQLRLHMRILPQTNSDESEHKDYHGLPWTILVYIYLFGTCLEPCQPVAWTSPPRHVCAHRVNHAGVFRARGRPEAPFNPGGSDSPWRENTNVACFDMGRPRFARGIGDRAWKKRCSWELKDRTARCRKKTEDTNQGLFGGLLFDRKSGGSSFFFGCFDMV